jgi:D-galactarolactone cycloisomerase
MPASDREKKRMKVTDVVTHVLQCKVDRPFVSARGWVYAARASCIVEITTDEGITGFGECYGPAATCKTIVDTLLKPRVVGRDPFDTEPIWEDLYNRVKDYGLTGMTIAGISGVDIALWDIVGRALGKPVHKLLGGAHRKEVIAYATGLYFIDMDRLTEEAVEEAVGYAEEGFRAIKMKIGLGDLKKDAARVAAVRRAIGPDIQLAVDANHCFSVPNAIRLGRMLEPHDILWFEEPISPEDHDGYVEVTRALDMAVAGGENDFTRWGFRDLIARKAMDIVQPDLCAAGGFSECRKIAALASAFGVECVPHAWGSAIGLAATVQFLAALGDQPPAFRPMPPMLEFEQTPNPLRDHLATTPIEQRAGLVAVPEGPGLGIEIDRAILQQYKVA